MWFKDTKWVKVCSLIGAHFTASPLAFLWSWGNLAPYLNSYYKFSCSPDCVDGSNQWVLHLYIVFVTPGLFTVGRLASVIGMKGLALLSALLCGVPMMASAWTVNISVVGSTILLGVLNGISLGTSLNTAMMSVNVWAPEKTAILSGTVTSLPPVLAFIQNQIVTAYVNPKNLKPDVTEFSNTYFSQSEILERVPNAIRILAGITLGMQLIGFLLTSDPPTPVVRACSTTVDVCKQGKTHHRKSLKDTSSALDAAHPLRTEHSHSNGKAATTYGSSNGCQHQTDMTALETIGADDKAEKSGTSHSTGALSSLVPEPLLSCSIIQAVKSASFWANSTFLAVEVYGTTVKNGYFKVFGLMYIPDDNLLTVLSSIIPLAEAAIRVIFGVLLNKNIISMKASLVISLSLNCVLFSLFYFAPQLHFVAYLVLIFGLCLSHGQLFVLYTTVTFKVFGPANFAMLYATGYLPTAALVLVAAGIVTPVLDTVGWFWLFMTVAAPSTLVLIAAVCTDVRPNLAAYL
ncbi:oxalate:formate antiporter-like isoform X1 [Elysia marginata]|uniref:Oxalate:formate antiporter-like isoform X1 n=1 Tax=Elysia marginata TaxID=1093978 RepID=A0AAV4IM39_9GAST|nr:oxalate:formate antiporter-like isoform X1 [Elysia marginata]